MAHSFFRKEAMEQIASPEEMHDYMRATNPRTWMVLVIVLALLVGFIVYASLAVMENTLHVKAEVTTIEYEGTDEYKQTVWLQVPSEKLDLVKSGMPVRLEGNEGKIVQIYQSLEETVVSAQLPESARNLPSGTYDAQIVLESISPLSFFLNGQ